MSHTATNANVDRLDENYRRSLMKIKVPVMVTLATKKKSVAQILELAPGAIIQFDKPCSDALSLDVNNRTIARGETVRVGQQLGLRLTEMAPAAEKFRSVKKPRQAATDAASDKRREN